MHEESNELYIRSAIIGHTLELIYQGKRDKAWQYFYAAYNLDDKKEIERRVKDILRDQVSTNTFTTNAERINS